MDKMYIFFVFDFLFNVDNLKVGKRAWKIFQDDVNI